MLRRVAPILGLLLVLVPAIAGRAEDANRACDNDVDVTIVVDFGALGGGVNVRCAPQPIKNGFDVFRQAGVAYETVSGSDFVCRIAAKPGREEEDCANTPPGNAYWTYWYAKPGGEWKYANIGPAGRKPPPGSYEGWAFKKGDEAAPPGYPVPAATAPATTTAPTQPGEERPPAAVTPTTPPRNVAPAAATTTAPALATATSLAAPPFASDVSASTTSTVKLGNVDLTARSGDGGTSTGFLLSVLAIAVIAIAGFVFVRSRG